MKILFSGILSVVVFLASFQNSLILIDYQLNRAIYEKNCVNKEKPNMHCHGKCQIKKEAEKQIPETKLVNLNFNIDILPEKLIEAPDSLAWAFMNKKSGFDNNTANLPDGFRRNPLNPPRVLL